MTTLTAIMIIKMTCNQLRAECKRANLQTTGLKADLRQRLLDYHQAHRNGNGPPENKENNDPDAEPKEKFPSADLVCPITLELPFDPVIAEDGRVYERAAIAKHIATQGVLLKSPMTNAPMGGNLVPALQHKNLIETLIERGVLGGDLVSNWNEKINEKKATEDLLKKADNGDTFAMVKVGNFYREGSNGFKMDYGLAYANYLKAHEAGDVSGTAMLGQSFSYGVGVNRCDRQGFMYLGLAAGKGSRFAAWKLANAFANGKRGMKVNQEHAIHWLRIVLSGDCTKQDLSQRHLEKAQNLLDELTGTTD